MAPHSNVFLQSDIITAQDWPDWEQSDIYKNIWEPCHLYWALGASIQYRDRPLALMALFREKDKTTPIVLVPTSFNTVYEDEFKAAGANIVIYANQLTRTGFPAMQNAAKLILENHRAKECDDVCMPFKDIIRLIPEE